MDERLRLVVELQNRASAEIRRIAKDMDGVRPGAGAKATASWFQTLEGASTSANKALRPLAGGLSTIGVSGLAAGLSVAGLVGQFRDLARSAPALQELSRQTGMTRTQIERLKYAAKDLNVDPGKMEASLQHFSGLMVEFHKSTGEVYAEMQNGASGLAEKIKNEGPEEAYKDILKWLAAIPEAAQRAGKSQADAVQTQRYWAQKALGDADMAQVVGKGMGSFDAAMGRARQNVAEITDDMIAQAQKLNESINAFDQSWHSFETTVAPTVFDNLRKATDDFREVFKEVEGAVTWFDKHKDHPIEDAGKAALAAIDAQAAANSSTEDRATRAGGPQEKMVVDVPGLLSKGIHFFTDPSPPAAKAPGSASTPLTLRAPATPPATLRPALAPSGPEALGILSKGLHYFIDPGPTTIYPSMAPAVPNEPKPLPSSTPLTLRPAPFHPDDDRASRARASDAPDRSLDGFVVGALEKPILHLSGTLKTAAAAIGSDGFRPAAFHPAAFGGGGALDPEATIAAGTRRGFVEAFREIQGMQDLDGKGAGGGGFTPASFGGGGMGGGHSPAAAGRGPSIRYGRQHDGAPYDDGGGAVPTGAHTPLKDLIAAHETGGTGAAGYDTVYGHAEQPNSKMAAFAPPKPITQMTIGEILAYQRDMKARAHSEAFPVGRAQWVERTLRNVTRGMDPNTVFSPEVQEKLFDKSIAGRMGQGVGGFQSEWDSLRHVDAGTIQNAIAGHQKAMTDAAASAPKAAADSVGPRGTYPAWMDDKSKREMAGINAPLARELLAASEATGTHFRILQGMRSEAEAAHNAMTGRGVVNSQHRWGAAADIKLTDAQGNDLDRGGYANFAQAFQAYSKAHGGNSRWLGGIGGRWSSDIAHFDQGLGYGQSHKRDPYGTGGPTADDMKEGAFEIFRGRDNPFTRAAKPMSDAADKLKAVVAPMPAVTPEPPQQPAMEHRVAMDPLHVHMTHMEGGRTRVAVKHGEGVKVTLRTAPTMVETA